MVLTEPEQLSARIAPSKPRHVIHIDEDLNIIQLTLLRMHMLHLLRLSLFCASYNLHLHIPRVTSQRHILCLAVSNRLHLL